MLRGLSGRQNLQPRQDVFIALHKKQSKARPRRCQGLGVKKVRLAVAGMLLRSGHGCCEMADLLPEDRTLIELGMAVS